MADRSILLVEDNPDDEALTLLAFEDNNVKNDVVVAHDGVEALEYLVGGDESRPALPQLVLLDLKLPRIDGLEVLRRLRAHNRTRFLPVVILTSSKEEEDILRGYESGCNAYVRKPVDFAEFSQAISSLGLFWLLLNRTPESASE